MKAGSSVMVPVVSEGAFRLFIVAMVCLLLGALVGAYAQRVLYGQVRAELNPAPAPKPYCPPAPECPVCPAPPDCGELGVIPREDSAPSMLPAEDDTDPPAPVRGLSPSVIPVAKAAFSRAREGCLGFEDGPSGFVVLDLTVTATSGQGRISELALRGGPAVPPTLRECLKRVALRTTFPWAEEGQLRLKYPLKIGGP